MFSKKTLPALAAGSLVLGALGTLAFSPMTYAEPPHNPNLTAPYVGTPDPEKPGDVWRIRAFRDANDEHLPAVNMDICAVYTGTYEFSPPGTHDMYRWYAISGMPGSGYGTATKEGDQVFMDGTSRYFFDYRHYMQWQLVSHDLGAGHWRMWRKHSFRTYNITIERIPDKECNPYPNSSFFVLNVPNSHPWTDDGVLHITNTGVSIIPLGALTGSMWLKNTPSNASGTVVFTDEYLLNNDLLATETIRLTPIDLENIATAAGYSGTFPWGGRAWMEIKCNNCPPDAIKVQMTGKRPVPGDPLVDLTPEVPEIREVDTGTGDELGTFTLLGIPPASSTETGIIRIYNTDNVSHDVWGTLYKGDGTALCSNVSLATIGPKNVVMLRNADVKTACGSSWTDKNAWLQIITKTPAGIIRVQYLVRDNPTTGPGVLSNISVGGQQ